MKDRAKIYLKFIVIACLLFLQSCILDEFKFGKVYLKDDWEMVIISPLFTGNFTFKDLAFVQDSITLPDAQPAFVMVSKNDTLSVPENMIYEPALIIEGFNFLIEGDDYITSASLHYIVTNGSPFPLQLQMYFYDKETPLIKGPAFISPFFAGGIISGDKVTPLKTIYTLNFTNEQLKSFKKSNRIDFITRFDKPVHKLQSDTIRADYPLDVSIILSGIVNENYE